MTKTWTVEFVFAGRKVVTTVGFETEAEAHAWAESVEQYGAVERTWVHER